MHRRWRQLEPDLVSVPAGPFLMGSTQAQAEAAAANFAVPLVWCLKETPQHSVSLEAFRISRAPITCAEYRAFVVATDHTPPAYWGSDEAAGRAARPPGRRGDME